MEHQKKQEERQKLIKKFQDIRMKEDLVEQSEKNKNSIDKDDTKEKYSNVN